MKKRCRLFTMIILSIITMGMLIVLTGCSDRTLDFKQMVNIEFDGLNGKGTVNIIPNSEKYYDKTLLEELYPEDASEKAMFKLAALMENAEYTVSQEEALSNGDEITVKVEYDKKAFEKSEITVANTKFTVKVEGLPDGTVIDVFEGLEIIYDGMSGKATAQFNKENCCEFAQDYVRFECLSENIANGDKITVTADYYIEDADDELVIVESDTKEYTVSGLQEAIEIDPFENLEITYTGASPYIVASLDSSKCDSIVKDYVEFETENIYLRNGDTFTVTALYNEYDADEYGFVLTSETKEYTVENQPEYVTSLDGLDLTALHAEMEDKLAVVTAANEGDNYFVDIYTDNFQSIASKTQKSKYFISLKSNFEDKVYNNYAYNRYIYVCEYIVNYHSGNDAKHVYVIAYANNICKNADGSIGWDFELDSEGYENYDSLINDFVTSEKEYYNVSEVKDSAEQTEAQADSQETAETT